MTDLIQLAAARSSLSTEFAALSTAAYCFSEAAKLTAGLTVLKTDDARGNSAAYARLAALAAQEAEKTLNDFIALRQMQEGAQAHA